jgi:preprotein translocase subunit SecF
MLFGICIGTYSSIYIAAPVIILWGVKRGDEEPEVIQPPGGARPARP